MLENQYYSRDTLACNGECPCADYTKGDAINNAASNLPDVSIGSQAEVALVNSQNETDRTNGKADVKGFENTSASTQKVVTPTSTSRNILPGHTPENAINGTSYKPIIDQFVNAFATRLMALKEKMLGNRVSGRVIRGTITGPNGIPLAEWFSTTPAPVQKVVKVISPELVNITQTTNNTKGQKQTKVTRLKRVKSKPIWISGLNVNKSIENSGTGNTLNTRTETLSTAHHSSNRHQATRRQSGVPPRGQDRPRLGLVSSTVKHETGSSCNCPGHEDTVCGTNERTYKNTCFLECS